jgi:hypothetical protein
MEAGRFSLKKGDRKAIPPQVTGTFGAQRFGGALFFVPSRGFPRQ